MNERIKQLIVKAWAERDLVSESRAFDDCFIDCYTKLLVEDIAKFVYNNHEMKFELCYTLARDIREQFLER